MNAQDSSSLHRSNTPLLNNFNRSDLNDNKKDYHMVKPDSEDASKAVSIRVVHLSYGRLSYFFLNLINIFRCNAK